MFSIAKCFRLARTSRIDPFDQLIVSHTLIVVVISLFEGILSDKQAVVRSLKHFQVYVL